MNQFLKTKPQIKTWLDEMKIKNYQLVPDKRYGFVVDVQGDVFLYHGLTHLPVKFNEVSDSFFCTNNTLISLEGCPKKVGGDFRCYKNELQSLKGCPESVGGVFNCKDNQLLSLDYLPQKVGGRFFCNNNPALGKAQGLTDFKEIFKVHERHVIEKEKEMLSSSVA